MESGSALIEVRNTPNVAVVKNSAALPSPAMELRKLIKAL